MEFRKPRDVLINSFPTTATSNWFEGAIQLQGMDDDSPMQEEHVNPEETTGSYQTDALLFPGNGFSSVRGLM